MKVENLVGFKLDYWTARADGICNSEAEFRRGWSNFYSPSTSWQTCGQLMDKHDVTIGRVIGPKPLFFAVVDSVTHPWRMSGPDRKTAICRAIIASVFGDEVPTDPISAEM